MNQQEHGLKFAGTVYARKKGTIEWFELGNTTSLTIKSSVEKDERKSFKKENFGQALDVLITANPPEISWENDTFNKRNYAFMLMGEAKDLDIKLQTVANEEVTLKKGVWIDLGNANIDKEKEITLKTNDDAPIDASKYTINHNLGMIYVHEDSDVEEGKGKITYTTREGGGFVIDAAALDGLVLELKVDGINRVTGEQGILNVWEANVAPDGDFDWLSGDWAKSKFSGTCITPSDKDRPYRFTSFAA